MSHHGNRLAIQHLDAAKHSSIEEHLRKDGQIVRRGEEPRMARDATHSLGRWIIDDNANLNNARVSEFH